MTQTVNLHNTLTRKTEPLVPLNQSSVTMYTCGLTVYSQPHIGNWLPYIYWDILRRTLEHSGYTVEHTQNITDVGHLVSDGDDGEDKMEKGARQQGKTAWDVADEIGAIADNEAYSILQLQRPHHLVPATSCIESQIAFAQKLEAKGYLYKTTDGMYFDTSKLTDYGKLARLDTEGLVAGSRVDMGEKRNVTDFAVWKFSPTDATRDMEWDSPWGKGFPGWHLECSVIAHETLGETIDIHCGGIDHIPVHHTNEIAQTEALTGQAFAQVWLHNNHIKLNGAKISKSLGNIITLTDITDKGYDIMAFKLSILSKHYRTEGNFSWDILETAQNRLNHWKAVACLRWQTDTTTQKLPNGITSTLTSLQDDLNTPQALAAVEKSIDTIQQHPENHDITGFFASVNALLGIDVLSLTPDITAEQKTLISERLEARQQKDWSKSDTIRDTLKEQGITLKDTSTSTQWSRQ